MIDDWTHLDDELQRVVSSPIEDCMECPLCGGEVLQDRYVGTQVEMECCELVTGLQKTDYLNGQQWDLFSMDTYTFPDNIEQAVKKIGVHRWNELVMKVRNCK